MPNIEALLAAAPEQSIPAPMPAPSRTLGERTGFHSCYRAEWTRPTRDPVWLADFSMALSDARSGRMVAFLGKRGTGKTQMAAEVAREVSIGRSRYIVWREFYTRIIAAVRGAGAFTEAELVRELTESPLLVIDELHEKYGSEAGGTDREARTLTQIIDDRYGNARPVIIISNETKKDFIAGLPDSVFSRFQQRGRIVEFKGQSHRANGHG